MNKEFWLGKFSLGIGLIFLSFLVAQIAKATFFLYITDSTYRNGWLYPSFPTKEMR